MSVEDVDIEEGRRRVGAGALLLDVREPDEWEAGHVDGAVWIPLGELTARHGELATGRDVVVMCRSGGRSAKAAEALGQWGYDAVNLAGGATALAAAGHPLVRDDGTPGTVV